MRLFVPVEVSRGARLKPRFPRLEMQRRMRDASLPGLRCPVSGGRAAAEGAVPVLAVLPALGALQGFPVLS